MGSHKSPSHYAVLIGIDEHPTKPLEGCVNDVRDVLEYLNGLPTASHSTILVAPRPRGLACASSPNLVVGSPTRENIVGTLKDVRAAGKSGDLVYIHYSGHGVRKPPRHKEQGQAPREMGLVCIPSKKGGHNSLLRGSELSELINLMVAKGLLVTVVLDCCFSGRITWTSIKPARYVEYDEHLEDEDSESEASNEAHSKPKTPVARNASVLPDWITDPNGYAVLTACSPDEEANEVQLSDKSLRGALSHYLLQCLRNLRQPCTMQELYHHLLKLIQKEFRKQTPMLYGNQTFTFFGPLANAPSNPSVLLVKEGSSKLVLQAGQAHGSMVGDTFWVSLPLGQSDDLTRALDSRQYLAEVTKVLGLCSEAMITSQPASLGPNPLAAWSAAPSLRKAYKQFPVLVQGVCEDDIKLGEGNPLQCPSFDIHLVDNGRTSFAFYVTLIAAEGAVVFKNSQGTDLFRRSVSDDSPSDRLPYILNIIEHLVRFVSFKEIANPSTPRHMQSAVTIQLSGRTRSLTETYDHVEVRDREEIILQVNNSGTYPLCLYLYSLGPRWEIEYMLREAHRHIPAAEEDGKAGSTSLTIRMDIPDDIGTSGQPIQEYIKIFVTSRPTSFSFLELPRLGTQSKGQTIAKVHASWSIESENEWLAATYKFQFVTDGSKT